MNDKKSIKLFRRFDLILIAALLIIGALLIFPSYLAGGGNDVLQAVARRDGNEIFRKNLSEITKEEELTIYDGDSVAAMVRASDGRICISQSECYDKRCVRAGWLSNRGESAACLPQRLIVSIESVSSDSDAITG